MPSKDPVIQALVENYLPTAVATLIEPFWLSINRLLCQLQPYEELQTPASAKRSLFLNYSSLPPQLTVLKAVRSGHLPLAVVCLMTLLANLLAIAFSGLFSHELRTIPSSAQFNPPLAAKVTFINGTYGPADGMSYRGGASMAGSFAKYNETGAFYGGRGEEQFLAAESHYQRGTPLPSWTDESLLYLPFMSSSPDGNTRIKYRARTKAFGAKLECENIVASPPDGNSKASIFSWSVNADLKQKQRNGSVVDCRVGTGDPSTAGDNGIITRNHKAHEMSVGCDTRKMAVELFYFPEAPSYYAMGRDILPTYAEIEACMPIVVFGWGRKTKYDCDQAEGYFLKCSQRVVVGDATVVVDSRGQLQEKVADFEPDRRGQETVDEYFSNNFENIFGQSNKYIFKKPDNTKYHNDSFASDSINYFMDRVADNSSHLDPNAPLPDFDITERLSKAYSQLFAIWLGVNKEKLFLPVAEGTTTEGMEFRDEERVVISKPLFIVSEIILWTYALVTAIVYFRRPGKYLPRMPTSIASVVTLFAASAAVEDFKGKLHLEDTECAELLGGQKYAFGSYVGRDGKVHVGVEKLPFVVPNEGRTYAVIEDGSLGRKQWARTSNGS